MWHTDHEHGAEELEHGCHQQRLLHGQGLCAH